MTFSDTHRRNLTPLSDDIMYTSKSGNDMWPGPYGIGGSRKYLVASCDQSFKRTGLEYFDIFYSHCMDPDTPLEETMQALDTSSVPVVRSMRGFPTTTPSRLKMPSRF